MPDPPTDLLDALAELSPRQRAALLLHDYAGYSASEAEAAVPGPRVVANQRAQPYGISSADLAPSLPALSRRQTGSVLGP